MRKGKERLGKVKKVRSGNGEKGHQWKGKRRGQNRSEENVRRGKAKGNNVTVRLGMEGKGSMHHLPACTSPLLTSLPSSHFFPKIYGGRKERRLPPPFPFIYIYSIFPSGSVSLSAGPGRGERGGVWATGLSAWVRCIRQAGRVYLY